MGRRFSQSLVLREACSLSIEAHLGSALRRRFSQSLVLRSVFFMHGGQAPVRSTGDLAKASF